MKYERGSFIVVPSREKLRGMPVPAQALYMWLCAYANETGECYPSRETLAQDCDCSKDTIDRMTKLLLERGLIEVENRVKNGEKQTNLYTVVIWGGSRTQRPPSRTSRQGVAAISGIELNPVLTEYTEVAAEKPSALKEVSDSEEEERPKKETRSKDKLAVYGLFSPKEQPWWRHAQQKKAALSLFDLVGIEKVKRGLAVMKENEDDKYCPQAATPFEYEEKLEALKRYAKNHA